MFHCDATESNQYRITLDETLEWLTRGGRIGPHRFTVPELQNRIREVLDQGSAGRLPDILKAADSVES